MQIKILDQVHLSGVRASTLAAGEVVEVSRDLGAELLKKHPDKFEAVGELASDDQVGGEAMSAKAAAGDQVGDAKSEAPPANKAEQAPANKAARPPRGKRSKS